tara:strand:+ start:645 stop:857 length:213 start_codon:yes stop_codon:yes gene_type:complete
MSDDWTLVLKEMRDAAKAEQRVREKKPENCFFCDYMDRDPGFCSKHWARPPADFMPREGACPDFIEEIPF